MSTIIYPSPIFGPVHSRRLGISLGINLLPADGKVCSFDCIYCECGFNEDHRPTLPMPTRQEEAKAGHFWIPARDPRNESIWVYSPEVKKPVAVRYAFRNFAPGNLCNQANLPLFPFRTDKW